MPYRAFISYSHAADGKLAPALQAALQRFAKPFYRLRALNVFRDQTSLAVTPALWPAIEKALSDSDYFILMASPEAADSHWVRQEVDYWLKHASADKILIVLTEGEIVWDDTAGDFAWDRTTALPENLHKTFSDEPLYLDLRWAKQEEDLSLSHPQFRDAVAELAATLHGQPKDDISGEDVRQHRRTRRLLWSGLIIISTLAVALAVALIFAILQYWEADRQFRLADERGKIALSRQLAAQARTVLDSKLDLALLLSVEAWRIEPTVEAKGALLTALFKDFRLKALLHGVGPVYSLALSQDGTLVTRSHSMKPLFSNKSEIVLWDMVKRRPRGPLLNRKGESSSADTLAISPDGAILAASASGRSHDDIILWDTKTWQPLDPAFPGQNLGIRGLALGPGGAILAVWTGHEVTKDYDDIYLWDLKNRRPLRPPLKGQSYLNSLAFSPDGCILASGGQNKTVVLWNTATWEPLGPPLRGHTEPVDALAFSPDGSVLASCSADSTVILWDPDRASQR